MIHSKSTFFLGIFIFLIPFLGLPTSYKTILITLSGLTLIALSVKIILPSSVTKKIVRHRNKKEKISYVSMENTSVSELDMSKNDISSDNLDLEQK